MRALSAALALLVAGQAAAQPTVDVQGKVALVPLTALTEGGAPLPPLEAMLGMEAARLPGIEITSAIDVRQAWKRLKKKELETCEDRADCLANLGRALGVAWVVTGETTPLPDGQVVYLKLVDVATGREVTSTTAVLDPRAAQARPEARAAMTRLLRPNRYMGSLALKIDVPNASVYVDGRKVALAGDLPLTVGTHAVRVTHPQYHDFVRFVDVAFDQRAVVEAPLRQYPIVADEMRQDRRPAGTVPPLETGKILPRPWYRKWWAIAAFGVVLVAGTAAVVYYTDGGVEADQDVTVGDP